MKQIPNFNVLDDEGHTLNQDNFQKGKFVFFFYPKDNTPACTKESCDFRDHYKDFKNAGFDIYGISKDSIKSHLKFKEKFQFPFKLLSDESLEMCKAFDVYQEKSFMGKKFMGVVRSTFIIVDGNIVHEDRNVSVTGHIDSIFACITDISKT